MRSESCLQVHKNHWISLDPWLKHSLLPQEADVVLLFGGYAYMDDGFGPIEFYPQRLLVEIL